MSPQAQRNVIARLPHVMDRLSGNTLIVGDLARWEAEGRMKAPLGNFQFVEIGSLTTDVVETIEPEIVLSPLVADDFDAVDVAAKLKELQYSGKYRAIAEDLPDADIIRNEIQSFAPQIDFDLLLIPAETYSEPKSLAKRAAFS